MTTAASSTSSDTRIWRSGGGRRIVLAFLFLLLLPFYASLGPMLFQRASRGLVGDTIALGVMALAFTALMALILQQLIHAVRTRVKVDAEGVKMTVPAVGKRGPFFQFRYNTDDVPYASVASVDTRSEVYGGSLAPVLLTATRLTTKDGRRVVLGYANANDTEGAMPYPEIGAEIARRAGVTVTDHGVVRRSVQQRVLGLATSADNQANISKDEIAALNTAHTRNLRLLVAALVVLVLGGITLDFATASRTTYAEMGAGMANPSTGAVPKKK